MLLHEDHEEKKKVSENANEFDEVSRAVIGATIEERRVLGPGFRETVYQKALARELQLRGLHFVSETRVPVTYKDVNVGTNAPDFIVEAQVALALKAVVTILDVHVSQLVSSMKATNQRIGLILNFSKKNHERGNPQSGTLVLAVLALFVFFV